MTILVKTRLRRIPENCKRCPLAKRVDGNYVCTARNERVCDMKTHTFKRKGLVYRRPSWCPLCVDLEADAILENPDDDPSEWRWHCSNCKTHLPGYRFYCENCGAALKPRRGK